jgi:hypothetical protein
VTVDYPLYCRQTDACSRKLRGCVKTLEGAKEFAGMGHVKPLAIVPDKTGRLPFLDNCAELNLWLRFSAGKLPCIAQKVLQCNLQERRIAVDNNPPPG